MGRTGWMVLGLMACSGGTTTTDDTGSDPSVDEETDLDLPAPAEPIAYDGDCPVFDSGSNDIQIGRLDREFLLDLPSKPNSGRGVLFLWHGNGDTAANFRGAMGASGLADTYGWIVVTMESGAGGLGLDWSVPPNQPGADRDFFDGVLSCLDGQYGIDRRKVYTAGFSAGALWSSWLVTRKADHLAAAVIFSGGTDGDVVVGKVNPYKTPDWDIPALLTHGGTADNVVVRFEQTVESMATQMRADGSTAIVCSHGNGHVPYPGFEGWAWDFLDAHVYGLKRSPYRNGKDPSGDLPSSCAWE